MPRHQLVVVFEWHMVAHGLWCDSCLLPSRYRVALVQQSTLRTCMTVAVCDDCGRQERER